MFSRIYMHSYGTKRNNYVYSWSPESMVGHFSLQMKGTQMKI